MCYLPYYAVNGEWLLRTQVKLLESLFAKPAPQCSLTCVSVEKSFVSLFPAGQGKS